MRFFQYSVSFFIFITIIFSAQIILARDTTGSFEAGYSDLQNGIVSAGLRFPDIKDFADINKIKIIIYESQYNSATQQYDRLIDLRDEEFRTYLKFTSTDDTTHYEAFIPEVDYHLEKLASCVAGGASCLAIDITQLNKDKVQSIPEGGYLELYVEPFTTLQQGTIRVEWMLYNNTDATPYDTSFIELPTSPAVTRAPSYAPDPTDASDNIQYPTTFYISPTETVDQDYEELRAEVEKLQKEQEALQKEVVRQKNIIEQILDFFNSLRLKIFG